MTPGARSGTMARMPRETPPPVPSLSIRHDLRPGDLGWIVHRHGAIYAKEQDFDPGFEAYVARPLAEFAMKRSPRERLFLAEQAGRFVGSIAVVEADPPFAQLRWFLVEPEARGHGVGSRLMREGLAFAAEAGYGAALLWTVSALSDAARLYGKFGFEKVEERPGHRWGVAVIEQRYDLRLRPRR